MEAESLESRFSSIRPRIEFLEVQDQYACNEDLSVKLNLVDYEVEDGDRIAIFKLGWQFIKEYVVFEWVPKHIFDNTTVVVFNKHCLPTSTIEIYQFCYITGKNVVHGASEPFQFCDNPTKMYQSHTGAITPKAEYTSVSVNNYTPMRALNSTDRDQEILRLHEENKFLREALKIIVAQNNMKTHSQDIEDLKRITKDLQDTLNLQQNEIKILKNKIRASGEEYKKLYIEKAKVDKRYDKLKSKLSDEVKVVEKTDNFDVGELESIPPFPFAK